MPDHCDELESLDPAERERRHFVEVPKQIARAMKAPGWAAHLAGVDADSVTSRAALEADLEQGRARGWYVTHGETVADLMAVAVPVELNGETYSVALAGPMHRMEGALKRYTKQLIELRAALEEHA